MKVNSLIAVLILLSGSLIAQGNYQSPIGEGNEPVAAGKFKPTWESLQQYKSPVWFSNAKFGIWAHWGSQCQPGQGDWYARGLYGENPDY
ncbi:alpha-L-fucosidase [Pedobacter sp. NJ-S-72]